jgi:hypothetical protein
VTGHVGVTDHVGGPGHGPEAAVRYTAAGADGRALEEAFRSVFAAPGGPGGLPAPSTFA